MKVSKWTKKLAAALVAGGMLTPAAALAAGLGTNLVTNPGFENVDPSSTSGGYGAVEILSWTDGSSTGFAYPHGDFSGAFGGPDYANGAPLAGGGGYYFTPNATDPDVEDAGQVSQLIDVSASDTASAIAAGLATFELSAYFSGYSTNGDFGTVQIDFLDAAGGPLAFAQVSDGDTMTWSQHSTSGPVPIGTSTVEISVFGTALSGGPDGYIDNVNLTLSQIPEPSSLLLAGLGLAGAGVLSLRRRK